MTPQERQLVDDLFKRLSKLEDRPRDPDAEDAIADGWDIAPNAAYALVQSVLVQEEALKRANERIRTLEAQLNGQAAQPQPQSFLDPARQPEPPEQKPAEQKPAEPSPLPTSVPSVHSSASASSTEPDSRWNSGRAAANWNSAADDPRWASPPPPQQYSGYPGAGGSFLGTAASAAAGVVGGALLMSGIRSLFGGSQGSAHAAAFDPGLSGGASPWGSSADSDLARDAGLNDIGHPDGGAGFLDTADNGDQFTNDADLGDTGDYDSGDVTDV